MVCNEIAYALSYHSLKAGDSADLLAMMCEDVAFGALTLRLDGRLVWRDFGRRLNLGETDWAVAR